MASLAGVVSAFFQLALTRGLADAVVAHPELDEEALSTAFWGNLLVAVALFALVQVAAGGFAWCFGQPLVAPMLRWFSLCFFTTALTFIPLATLRRRLRFGTYAVRAAIGAASGGLVGIAMALTGFRHLVPCRRADRTGSCCGRSRLVHGRLATQTLLFYGSAAHSGPVQRA